MIKLSIPKLVFIALVALLLTTLSSVFIQQRVSAQTNTATEEAAEETDDETVTNNIRQLILETASRVKGTADSQKRAIVGEVQRITDEALTVQRLEGQQIIPLAESLLLNDDQTLDETIEVEDLAVGNWVTIVGTIDDQSISPDFIFVSEDSLRTDPQIVVIGTITDLSTTTITIRPRDGSSEQEITIATNTDFQDPEGESATLNSFVVDMAVLITGFSTDEEVTASTIRSLAPLETNTE